GGMMKALFSAMPSHLQPAAGMPAMPRIQFSPAKLQAIQQQYQQAVMDLWNQAMLGKTAAKDKRFQSEAWSRNPMAGFAAAQYLLQARTLASLVDAVEGDEKTRARLRFAVEQWNAASAPSNFLALNAEAQQRAIETKGESIAKGLQNLLGDLRQGHVSMTDESQFEVGRNVATSQGAVVFENELFQLIEYKPLTAKVYERPFLLVPPCINKFYILDLAPQSSFVRYCVAAGHTVFMVSWRNPGAGQAHLGWDDYLRMGVVEAIAAVRSICGSPAINALGFCVGGTILASALAALTARGEEPVASLTLLATLLDFSDVGSIGVYIDAATVAQREALLAKGGLVGGRELMAAFASLRPRDLIWNSATESYLMGRAPQPFDLLYWNADSTNLPGPMYCHYLRSMYLENRLREPGGISALGESVDLRRLKMPAYVLATREDHIVPWRSAFATSHLVGGPVRFALGASGHIAGIVNPAHRRRRSYWASAGRRLPASAEDWLAAADEVPGSWWNDWARWSKSHLGRSVAAPRTAGNAKYKPLGPAPGEYVKVRVS
ncbi:MAG: PHA/PHB synthase family protein, partial [Burkholderiales bacterium]